LSLNPGELRAIEGWVRKARPKSGVYFRSVSYKYIDPEMVLDGAGTEAQVDDSHR
jgi:hypothetical protein